MIIIKNAKNKTSNDFFMGMKTVCRFTSRTQTKYSIHHVYVTNGFAVATDGHRLAEYKLPKLADDMGIVDGFYTVKSCTSAKIELERVENVGSFPKYQDVLIKDECNSIIIDNYYNHFFDDYGFSYEMNEIIKKVCDISVNVQFLEEIPFNTDNLSTFKLKWTDNKHPIELQSDTLRIVLMPVEPEKCFTVREN
jgi:hypothetical protein